MPPAMSPPASPGTTTPAAPPSARPRLRANPKVQILLNSTIAAVDHGRVLVRTADGTGTADGTAPGTERWLDAPGELLLSQGVAVQEPALSHDIVVRAGAIQATEASTIRQVVLDGKDQARAVAEALAAVPGEAGQPVTV